MKTRRAFELTEFAAPTRIRWAERSKNLVTAREGGYDHGPGKLIAPLALRSARKGADDFGAAIKAAVEASLRRP
jgi:hypothetical protein